MHNPRARGPSNVRRLGGAIGIVLTTSLAPWLAATTAAAQAAPGPQLSVAIDDGQSSAAVDDELTYAITVQNLGDAPVDGLVVTQTRPDGLAFGSADAAGADRDGFVRWVVDVPATGKVVVHSTMTVTKTPKTLLRIASVACAAESADAAPLVCATDSDQLPAGASATTADEPGHHRDGPSSDTPWALAGAAAAVAVAIAALVVRRRRS
jgi:uncharacterized repeat protein (TIGR01451 family)